MKRTTPENDVDRLAERLWQRGRGKISNRDDFDAVFDGYLTQGGQKLTKAQRQSLRDNTFKVIRKKYKVSSKTQVDTKQRKQLFKSAGRVVSQSEFNITGRSGQRTVFLRRTIQVMKRTGKPRTVYRDNKGRYGTPVEKVEQQPSSTAKRVTYDPTTGKYV